MEVAWSLRGFCVGFARNLILFCLNVNAKDINVSLPVLYLQSLVNYLDQELISVRALVFDLVQLTFQKRFDCRNAIFRSSETFLDTS